MSFPTFDQSLPCTKKTNRTLENELSNARSVVALNQENESNSWKRAFQHSISRCPEPRKRIELLKMSFPTFDQSLPWTKKTNRTLENELSNIRSVVALNQENESNSWKWAFQHSISRCPEPRKRIELLKMSFPTFDQSLPWTIECWKAHFQEFDSFSWFRATTDRMLESSFSRVRFVFLVQGNDWSNVGKLVFKSSIRFLGSGQGLIECWKAHFQEFNSFSWFRATTDRVLESSFSRVRFVFLVQGNDWSNVGKLNFQEFDSFSWFRATTDRMLESSFSRVRFVYLVQGNDWSNVGKLIFKSSIRYLVQGNDWSNVGKLVFKSSIRFLGSGQRLIECWKARFQEFDSFTWFRATTDRMLESSFSRVRFVFLVQGNDWSNVGKLVFKSSIHLLGSRQRLIECWKALFKSSIRFLGSGQRLIECWKARFQEFDSFSWFRARTDRVLESSFSRVRFVFLVQGNDWSSVGKLIFKSSIRLLGSGQRLIECWKAHFQEFDSFSWFRATTNRMLESSFSRVRFVFLVQGNDWSNVGKLVSRVRFVFLVQGNDWSNVGKLIFKSSIRFLGSEQRLIECWKAHFQEFDSFSWFRATTDRMLESSFSRVRFVFLVQGNDWSNVGKLVFKSSIRFLGSGQRLIECWKAHFQEFDSFSWFRATTDRMLESSFSRVRFVFLVQGNDWSNVGKLIFKSSIRLLGSGQRLIERWKAHFQEFDSFSWFRATTDRMLESSFSRVRFVFLVQGNDWSNVGKLVFKSSIRLLGSGQRLIECWKAQFSRVRFVFLVQGNDWSNVGKLVFKSSIRLLGSGQRLIECWKARFQEFDSFSWFRATTDRMLESSFSRVRFVFLVQGKDWSSVGKLIFKSSIRFLGSGQRLIECWKARFQEFDSFSWFRARTDRALESSFPRVRFVYLVQSNDWSNVGKLIFKSSIRFLGSGQRLIECWKAHFQEFDSFSRFRATTDRMLESSFSRVRFVFLVQGNDWRKRIELLKTSFPTFDQSLPWTKKTNRTLENELSNIRSVLALNQENESNSWKWAFQHSISRCSEPRKRIELLKTSFPTLDQLLPGTKKTNRTLKNELSNIWSVVLLDQSLPWTKKTNRTLENELSNIRSVVALNQVNESNSWKWAFQRSISRCPEPSNVGKLVFKSSIRFLGSGQRLIERWKAHFQEFDSFTWFRATTDRMLESSFSRVRFVFLVQGNDWSNVGKLVFKSSIRFLGSGQRLIECWKARFQEFDSFTWFRARTDRVLESSFSRVRFVFLVQGNDWSNVGKLVFKSSIRLLGWGQRLIECWKAQFSRVRFVFLVQGNDWSNVGKLVFKSSIRFLGSGQRLIECWKAHFQEFDSFSWFRATTDRMLESSFSRVRFVFLVQGNDWSNVGKLIFKSSIRFLGSGQGLIECWKARFQEFDSFSWFRARTDRALESSFPRVRFVYLVQSNDWSNVGKLVFKSSIRFLGSGQRLIECWKARFQEFDSFSWFRATTDRMLESSFSRVRFVFLVQGNDWSNVGKLIFKSSIRFLGSGQRLIECWKAHFQEFDSFSWFRATTEGNESNSWKWALQHSISPCPEPSKWIELLKTSFPTFDQSLPWTKKTNRTLENELSNARSVVALNQVKESNSWKWAFQHSISRCPEPSKRIELLKMSFPTFDQSLPWTKKTNRTLENELSNIRSVVALNHRMLESSFSRVQFVYLVQGNDWSNVGKLIFKSSIRFLGSGQRLIERWKAHFQEFNSFTWFRATTEVNELNSWKWAFQRSISPCPEPRKRIELLKTSFPTFDQSLPWTKKTNRTLENELSNIRSVVALHQENESNSWKRAFQRSISRCPEPRKRIELLKTSFPTFDQSLPWTKKTNRTLENELSNIRSVVALNHRMLESSFSRVRFVFLVQGNDWSNVGKLIFKSSIRFLGSGQRLIECWKAHFQEFDSFSWFRATTDRMLESSFSRVRFVFLVQGNDWSNVGKLIFKSSIRFLGSGQRLIECWKARFQEFDSFSWFRARTDRMLESSFSRVRFVYLVQGNDWSSVGKLVFKSSICFLGSGQRLIECWKAQFSRVRFVFLVQGNDWSNVGKLVFKSSIRFLGSGQRLIECWKAHFQEFDSLLGSGQRLIECWKARFQEFDSFPWFRATTDRMLESSFSRVRFVYLVQGNDWSNVGKLIFKSSIRFLGSGQRLIECWKARFQEFDSFTWFKATTDRMLESSFQEFDSFSWFRATTDRMLESSFSRVRFVFLVQGKDWSSVGKLVFKSSIRFLGSGQRLIERWKAHFQEFNSFTWFRATTDRMLESSFSRVRFVFLVQGND